jgi:ribonuclease G
MAKEICISSTPHETRLAILEDDQLAEIYYERENEYTLAGSIYNGRVTRVLPGMQSAFVDIGLERDAFLYVTDFLELEDPEETDELEKAAASGGNTAPREVRHDRAQKPAPIQESKPEPKPEQKAEERGEARPDRFAQDKSGQRPGRERRPAPLAVTEEAEPQFAELEAQYVPETVESAEEDANEAGARRWRGRRRRRSGRAGATSPVLQGESASAPAQFVVEESIDEESDISPEIHASAAIAEPVSRHDRNSERMTESFSGTAATPFVLPGESLSKYGGTGTETEPEKAAEAAPARPASTYKPSTLIEAPLEWDGSGLLPGESISRHKIRQPEPEPEVPEPRIEEKAAAEEANEAATTQRIDSLQGFTLLAEGSFLEELVEEAPEVLEEIAVEAAAPEHDFAESEFVEEEMDEEELIQGEHIAESAETTPEAVVEDTVEEVVEAAFEATPAAEAAPADEAEPEENAEASHNIDPSPSTGFRLFGLGGKKKKEDEAAAKPAAPASAAGDDDQIEEEELVAPRPRRRGKAEANALQEFEEEALPARPRAGDAGSVMHEASRIQLEEGGFDEEDEDEEEGSAEGQPSGGEAQGQPRRDRNDRGGRGKRGKPGPGGPQGMNRGRGGPSRRSAQMSDLPVISDLLKPGQEILVQIAKEPIAKKGARITSHIALPGRFLVFMPTVTHVGVSRKIASDEERQRLKRILVSERGDAAGGFIVRTAAEGASEEELRADLRFLLHLWNEIKTRSDSSKSPALIYHDLSLIERILRDQVSSNFSNIWVDSEADYERIVRFLNRFSPTLVRRVKLYTKETPLFEHFGIQDEISKALRSKVWLKSGGSIVINQTEALVAIDINTGKYVGKSARLEDTIVKTNLDAVPEIVRQIRLRDLGGIIVIDFIDMDDRKNRYKVMAALEEALKSDRAPTKVLQFNDFGLVAITRKRVKQSLERTLSVPCPTCQATGMVKSPTTVCNEIYTELRKMKKQFQGQDVMLRVNPETVKVLKANNASWVTEFEELVEKNILIKSDPALHPEQFDIQG